jgi:hypothetical protein
VVWAQDYHLMLLPAMLKKQHPKMKVGTASQLLAPGLAHNANYSSAPAQFASHCCSVVGVSKAYTAVRCFRHPQPTAMHQCPNAPEPQPSSL